MSHGRPSFIRTARPTRLGSGLKCLRAEAEVVRSSWARTRYRGESPSFEAMSIALLNGLVLSLRDLSHGRRQPSSLGEEAANFNQVACTGPLPEWPPSQGSVRALANCSVGESVPFDYMEVGCTLMSIRTG